MADIWLIAGLGNPGKQYQNTRHNAGFMAVDALAQDFSCSFKEEKDALSARADIEGKTIYLLKPQTYMNLSGDAVSHFANFYKIPHQNILIIFDDMALPLGAVRIRREGSAGGQNGMKHIIERLGTQQIARLRIGIGPRPDYFEGKDFVLSKFNAQEETLLKETLQKTVTAVRDILAKGLDFAMTRANQK